jgi:hypothetical protein
MARIEVPPIDPRREQALLNAFDAHWVRPRKRRVPWSWVPATTAAALVATVAGLNWLVFTNAPPVEPIPDEPPVDMTGFVPLPGAGAWPRFESGSLVRMDVPVSALSGLGLQAQSPTGLVKADVVIGQDGVARAIRVVQ